MGVETNIENGTLFAATTIARGGWGVMLRGPSGSGKSDLALRAISTPLLLPGEAAAEPFRLVSDDQTELQVCGDAIVAVPPAILSGLIEVRGLGIQRVVPAVGIPLALIVDLAPLPLARMPDYPGAIEKILDRSLDVIGLAPFEASAPIKLAMALARSVTMINEGRDNIVTVDANGDATIED